MSKKWVLTGCVGLILLAGGAWSFFPTSHSPARKTLPIDVHDAQAKGASGEKTAPEQRVQLPKSAPLAKQAESAVSFQERIGNTPLYQEYKKALEEARSSGTRTSCLEVLHLFGVIEADRLKNSNEGASTDPSNKDVLAAAAMLKEFETDIKGLPQYASFPELMPLVELQIVAQRFKLNDPRVFKVANSPAQLQDAIAHGAPPEAVDQAQPGMRELAVGEQEAAEARDLIEAVRDAPPYENRLLEKYKRWYAYLATTNIEQALGKVTLDFSEVATLIHSVTLPPDAPREEQYLAARIDAAAFAYAAKYSYAEGAPQEWTGPEDVIQRVDRHKDARGFPLAEARYRIDQLESQYSDLARGSDTIYLTLLRQSVDQNYLDAWRAEK